MRIFAAICVVCLAAPVFGAERIYLLDARGDVPSFSSPGEVAGARRVAVPETGGHLLVLTASGRVVAWGQNLYGQLGAGDRAVHGGFVDVGLTDVVGIAAGAEHSLALKNDGTVWAWGANTEGQLGDGTLVDRAQPGLVPGLRDVSMVAAGVLFSMALKRDGTVCVFGSNWSGIAPDDGRKLVTEAVRVDGLTGIVAIGTRDGAGYALDGAGQVWRWDLEGVRVVEDARWKALLEQKAAGLGSLAPRVGVRVEGGVLRVGERGYAVAGAPVDVAAGWAVAVLCSDAATSSAASGQRFEASSGFVAPGSGVRGAASRAAVVTNSEQVVQVVAVVAQTYVLTAGGAVRGWGSGAVGDGTSTTNKTPVCALISGVTALAAGDTHAFALRSDGTVWVWGFATQGEFGDGSAVAHFRPVPSQIPGLSGVVAIASGRDHGLALKADGTVWAWGGNGVGQLGTGAQGGVSAPAVVPGLSGIVAIAAGWYHSLALRSDGAVFAWGDNTYGQLGDGTYAGRSAPAVVAGLSAIRIDTGNRYSVGIDASNRLWIWGDSYVTSTSPFQMPPKGLVPVLMDVFDDVASVAQGNGRTVVLRKDGSVWGWTLDGVTGVPENLNAPPGVVALTGGVDHIAVLLNDGTVRLRGSNANGALGRPDLTESAEFVAPAEHVACTSPDVKPVRTRNRLSAGGDRTFVVGTDGLVWGAGDNRYGQLGDGTKVSTGMPVAVAGLTGRVAVAGSGNHALAIGLDGLVKGWGNNVDGQIGDGTTSMLVAPPVAAVGVVNVVEVSASMTHSLARTADGQVWVWGSQGCLHDTQNNPQSCVAPTLVTEIPNAAQVAAGDSFSLVLRTDGTVWGWGVNSRDQINDSTELRVVHPVQIAGLSDVVTIAAGRQFGLALRKDGTVWTWGSTQQLGVGRVPDLTEVVSIAAGDAHGLAVRQDGTVWGWGDNFYGQLGVAPTMSPIYYPQRVEALFGVAAVRGGAGHSLAWKRDGSVWAWGNNAFGQFGVADPVSSATPILSGFQPGLPLAETPVGVTAVSGSSAVQNFDLRFRAAGGSSALQWVQALFAVAPDGGGQPFCFLHYDVAGNGLWLYGEEGFFVGPVAPGSASNALQNSFCAVNPAATSIAANGADLTVHAQVIFKQAAARNVYLRSLGWAGEDSGWVQMRTWDSGAAALAVASVSPNAGSGAAATLAAQWVETSGLTVTQGGWVQLLVAAASDGGGQPFCFVHYDRGGNGLWMYSSDVGFFLGPVAPGVSSTALQSSACSVNPGGTTVQTLNGTLVLTVPMSFTPAMSGAKKVFQRSLDALRRDTGWIETGSWMVQ